MPRIRPEKPEDIAAIHVVNEAAFPTRAEADLVDTLRDEGAHVLSLVAVDGDRVVGHILFSPVHIETESGALDALGLGPMAVLPARQRGGIGSKLVTTGLTQCTALDYPAVVVLGHPDYYPRFGFVPAHRFGITCEFPSPPEAFMIRELQAGALAGTSGIAKYHAAFDAVSTDSSPAVCAV